jgi:translation initiation factor IF-2
MAKDESKITSKNEFVPVVTLLGHVDHGKTSLLDALRSTNVVAREFGGITQHIGAHQLIHKGRKITFIDTPGHAAFEKMRSRGAEVADIAILVVAANDGVKPQTQEAIKHIKNSKVPMIVAINKIDLPNLDLARVRNQLLKEEVSLEESGGEVPVVLVSAKTKKGLDELLDMIILVSDLGEKHSETKGDMKAVVIESYLDKAKGPVVNVIIKSGTLRVGDEVVVGKSSGKVRALISDQGKNFSEALPSTPVEISGIKKQVEVGSILTYLKNREVAVEEEKTPISLTALLAQREEVKNKLKIILKTDVSGSKEAILENLPEEVYVISQSTGEVSEYDLMLAKTSGAIIYAFNSKVGNNIQKLADQESVEIKKFNIIYNFFEDLDEELGKLAAKKEEASILGKAKVIAQFEIDQERIAGCKVTEGELIQGGKVRLLRDGEIIGQSQIKSLHLKQQKTQKVTKGVECGVGFQTNIDFAVGDILELLPL